MTTPSERVQRLREAADYIDKDGPWTSRWDRAADETHDLLALLFERHREVVSRFGPNTCWGDSKPFPCPTYTAALAVLDALDPQEAK